MIQGVHAMFYTSRPEATRAFFRDVIGFPFTDVGEGWLIFDVPEGDLGFHPAEPEKGTVTGTPSISFYCDDINKTVAELQARGVEFTGPVEDHGYGLVTFFKAPGDFAIQLYQPRYVKNKRPAPAPAPAAPARKAETPAPAKAKPPARPAPKKPARRAVAKTAKPAAKKPAKKTKSRRR